jgi:hypothetical protein
MRARALLLLAAAASASACELVSHAFDYQVGAPPAAPAGALCAVCLDTSADLRHAPCPTPASAPDLDRAFVFAARRSYLGHGADLTAASFDLGFDLDCSDRPDGGLPVLCAPRAATGWAPLPHGIDNALLGRVIAPIYDAAPPGRGIDLDTLISDELELGRYGVVVAVSQWNGLPDDDSVEVTLRSSPGLASGGLPAWGGGDVWAPYPDVDADGVRRFALDRAPGYVAGGVLVVDARALGARLLRFGPGATHLDLLVADLTLAGALTPDRLDRFTLSGILAQPAARSAALGLAASVGPCSGGRTSVFLAALPAQIAIAPDMPTDPSATPADPCDAISFGWALDAESAQLAAEAADAGSEDAGGVVCP